MPPLPSRMHQQRQQTNRSHPRQSLLSHSFSLGPEPLVQSSSVNFGGGGVGTHGMAMDVRPHHSDPNASVMAASPRNKRIAAAGRSRLHAPRSSILSGTSSQANQSHFLSATPANQNHFRAADSQPAGTQTQTATEPEEGADEADALDEEDWSIVDRMRLWRHDAILQHLHDSAVFWGDKILSWTGDPADAFWLAQAHFLHQQYSRAEQLLTRPFVIPPPRSTPGKGKGRETSFVGVNGTPASGVIEIDTPARANGAGLVGGFQLPDETQPGAVSRLVDMSVACRYLAAQCMVRSGRWPEALEMLGETNPWRGTGRSGPSIPNPDGGIKVEASMCYLRGVLMTRLNRHDRAKEHFMEALSLDVKCFDAFHELTNGNLLGVDEEWDFVQGLQFMQQIPEDADFVKLIYEIRLKKEKHAPEMAQARQRLLEDYGMGENPDVLFSFAEAMYAQYRWEDAFTITSRIQELVGLHPASLPTHIACMNNLRHLHPRLFLLAHELVDKEPDAPVSWYAVGVYYLMTRKFLDARKFFSKANLMDPRFGPAWIGFAHSYSYEGEHDHAIVAYSTAARLFPGMHLPALFLGMEYLQINNFALAKEYFNMSHSICDGDPLLYNERGVLAFNEKKYEEAAGLLQKAIELAQSVQGTDAVWATTYLNLGQAYRRLERFAEAKASFEKVVELNPRHAQGYSCLGIVSHILGSYDDAIAFYHESLSIEPLDTNTIDLLNLALEINMEAPASELGVLGLPGGAEAWHLAMTARHTAAPDSPKKGGGFGELGVQPPLPDVSGISDSSAMDMA